MVSVDERMVRSKNRLGIWQFIKNKPVKFGIKLWVLAEARTIDFEVYTGTGATDKGGRGEKIIKRKGLWVIRL